MDMEETAARAMELPEMIAWLLEMARALETAERVPQLLELAETDAWVVEPVEMAARLHGCRG